VIQNALGALLAGNPFVDEVIPFDRNASGIAALWRKLRAETFDVAVDFQGLIQSAMIAAAGSAKVVGTASVAGARGLRQPGCTPPK
jgi:ADP-heptose:LPS heptosyltransferase